MTTEVTWNTGSGAWFTPANWDAPNPNPPPPLLHYVPGIGNNVIIPDKSGIGTPFTITYAGTSTINSLTSTGAATLSFQTGALTIGNGGGTGVFNENGIFNVASGFVLTNNAGTLSLNGGTLAGNLAGSGTFRFINGTFDLNAGLSMTVANWLLTHKIGSATVSTTNLNTDLTYGGNFTIDAPLGNAAILNLNSRVLTLSGTSGLGGNIVGPGTLRILGNATLNGGNYLGGALLQIAKTVTQTGTASQAGGYGLLGTLRVDAGASYTITAASNIDSLGVANQALVVNNGSFGANGVSASASRLAVGFTNGVGATLSVAAGATLKLGFADFRGTTNSLYNGAITGAGRLWLSGNSSLNTTTLTVGSILAGDTTTIGRNLTYGGQFTLASFAALKLGNRTLTLSGASDFTTGFNSIDGPGTLRITGTSTFGGDITAGSGAALTLRNSGAITQTGGIYLENGSTLLNDAGRTYTLAGGGITLNGGSVITNNGTFLVTTTNTAFHATDGGSFTNAGTLDVGAGATLVLGRSGGSATLVGMVGGAGGLVLAGTAAVNTQIGTASLAMNGNTTLGVDLAYAGAFSFGMHGRINLAGHTLTLSGTSALTGGFNIIDGPGTLKVSGNATFEGFSVGNTTGATLQNSGAITQTGSIYLENGSTLLNDAGRTYTLAGGGITLNGGSTITNNGTFLVTSAISANHDIAGGSFTNTGTLQVDAGATFRFGLAGSSATLGGTVGGAGTLVIGNAALNSGVTTAGLILGFGGTTVLGLDMTYAGAFDIDPFATLALNGHTLTLTGRVVIEGNVEGSAGIDKLIIKSSLADLSGLQLLNWTAGTDILEIGGTSNADSLLGTSYGDAIAGGNGNDTLNGGAGNDTLIGGAGNDSYLFDADAALGVDSLNEAGGGIDTLNFAATTAAAISLNLGLASAQLVNANLSLTLGSGATFENVIGGALADTLAGNGLANSLTGGGGNDTLTGGAGNDSYLFDADLALGSDSLDEAGGGIDTLNFAATTTRSIVLNLGQATSQVLNANLSLTLGSAATFENVIGGSLADTITGNGLNNSLTGGGGNDTLAGGGGNDTLAGGGGNDSYLFDTDLALGSDTLDEAGGGIDTLNFAATTTRSIVLNLGQATSQVLNANLSLTLGSAAIFENVIGGSLADTIIGNSLNNSLTGGGGNDTLVGGLGADRFRFATALNATTNRDVITDFTFAQGDTIELENAIFTALPTTGLLAASAFRIGTAATDGNQRILYDNATGLLSYDSDGNGATAAVAFATLTPRLALTSTSFTVT